jgi:hypothetical protein
MREFWYTERKPDPLPPIPDRPADGAISVEWEHPGSYDTRPVVWYLSHGNVPKPVDVLYLYDEWDDDGVHHRFVHSPLRMVHALLGLEAFETELSAWRAYHANALYQCSMAEDRIAALESRGERL